MCSLYREKYYTFWDIIHILLALRSHKITEIIFWKHYDFSKSLIISCASEKYYTFFRLYLYFEEELHLNKKVSKMATWPNFDRILDWIIKSLNEENRKSAALTKKDDRNVIREKRKRERIPSPSKLRDCCNSPCATVIWE